MRQQTEHDNDTDRNKGGRPGKSATLSAVVRFVHYGQYAGRTADSRSLFKKQEKEDTT